MNSRYALLSKLSTSLYGEIYLAKDKYAGNQVVVKLSSVPKKSNCTENPGAEIELLERLREAKKHDGHQYIIKLVEAFPVTVDGDDLTCMVMEYAPGGDMLDKIISCEERKKKNELLENSKIWPNDGEGRCFPSFSRHSPHGSITREYVAHKSG